MRNSAPPASPDGGLGTMTLAELVAELTAIGQRHDAIVAELSARAAAERARWSDEQVAAAWDQVRHALYKERSLTDW